MLSLKIVVGRLKRWRPKLPPAYAEFARRHLARYTPSLLIWGGATSLLVIITCVMLAKIFLAGHDLTGQAIKTGQRVFIDIATGEVDGQAIKTGQRVFIDIATGEVDGNARHTQAAEVKAPTTQTASTDTSSPIISKDGLAPAPLAAISEQSPTGLVPTTGKDGTLPWKYYGRPYHSENKRPMVAIIITDLALSKPQTEETLKLPHAFTLSFSPYAGDTRKWATSAREKGFETLIDLPMQSLDYVRTGNDPGPYGLLEEASEDQNSNRLLWVLSRFSGYVGALAPENESMTGNTSAIRATLTELTAHGVLFLYIKTTKNESLADMIKARQFYALGIDKVLDDDIEPGPIDAQLDSLTTLAKTQGYAIGFAHSYPPTLAALARWSDGLAAQGVDLAPVSAIALKLLP